MQVGLADEHGAGGGQAACDLGVFRRHAIVEDGAGRGGAHGGGVDVVLERDRNAVQRPAELAGALLGVSRMRACAERLLSG